MNGFLDKTTSYLKRSSPTILTCLSIVGVIGTTALGIAATPKALDILELHKWNNGDGPIDGYDLSKTEIAKLTWQCYIPTALAGLTTIACIAGINVLSKRNQASLASAYSMLSESYRQYRKAVNALYGEDADSRIKAEMVKDTYVSADGYSVYDSELDPESEKILCYDLFSKRYFSTQIASVLNAQYHINRNLSLRGYASINEFYDFLGLDKIEHGDDMGWSYEQCVDEGIIWLDFENTRAKMDDGMECCIISALWDPNTFSFED